jgi:hypothetical protein
VQISPQGTAASSRYDTRKYEEKKDTLLMIDNMSLNLYPCERQLAPLGFHNSGPETWSRCVHPRALSFTAPPRIIAFHSHPFRSRHHWVCAAVLIWVLAPALTLVPCCSFTSGRRYIHL